MIRANLKCHIFNYPFLEEINLLESCWKDAYLLNLRRRKNIIKIWAHPYIVEAFTSFSNRDSYLFTLSILWEERYLFFLFFEVSRFFSRWKLGLFLLSFTNLIDFNQTSFLHRSDERSASACTAFGNGLFCNANPADAFRWRSF